MTNKPFEVQDDTIILNGVDLQVTPEGSITLEGNPVSGGITERSVNFPHGETGDTRGDLALTPEGNTYICVDNYVAPMTSSVNAVTNQEFDTAQSGGQFITFYLTANDYSELQAFFGVWDGLNQINYPFPNEFTVETNSVTGVRTCVSCGYSENGDIFLTIEYVSGDPTLYPIATQLTVTYVTSQLPNIWVRLDNSAADRLTNGVYDFVLDGTGNVLAPGDIKTGTNGGRFLQDCDAGTTSMRWINVTPESGSTQILRAYTGDPSQQTEVERAQVELNWQGADQSGLTIKSFDQGIFTTEHNWEFRGTGDLVLPQGGDIKDSNGNSVLGGAVPNTKRGWINLVGDRPNNYDEAWFESVVVNGAYAYVLGGDYYTDGGTNLTKIYKFDLETGNQVWVKQIVTGRNASFDFAITSEVITITAIASGGLGYLVGEELYFPGWIWSGNDVTNRVTVVVDTVDEVTGAILTASIKPGYNLTGISNGTFTGLVAENNNAQGDVNSIAYDSFLNKLVVVSEYRSGLGDVDLDSYYTWTNVYVVDPTTGNVDQGITLSGEGDLFANSIKLKNTQGGAVIVGEKYGEFREFGTLVFLRAFNGYFDILKSDIDAEHYPGNTYDWYGDFWLSGTGISTISNVDNVNYYENLTVTTREGSGAEFAIIDDGAGGYTLIGVNAGGTNYLAGHKIKILGSALSGVDVTNDAIVTVTTVDTGGIITAATISGTAGATGTWTNVSGTNYNVGSGALFAVYVNAQTGALSYGGFSNPGSNYVVGDVLTVAGTTFANGTSPANNGTMIVGSIGISGDINSVVNGEILGTAPTDALRIIVNGVDFTPSGGSWTMKQNLGGEAFVWTPLWSNAIGGPSGDRFYDVCYSQDGNSIFAVGRGRYETAYDQALVVKFNGTTGAVIWGKDIKFSEAATENREARAVCLVPGSSDLIVAGAWYNNSTNAEELILTRITEAGVAVWQKTYLWNNDSNPLDVDYEINLRSIGGDIVVSLELGTPIHSRGLGYLIINTDGTVLSNRVLSADGNSNYNFYNTPTPNFADVYTDAVSDDYVVMAGHTYVPTDNYYNALLFKLPLDGYKDLAPGEYVSLGEHILGRYWWDVTTVTPAFDSFTATEHLNTITLIGGERDYKSVDPSGLLNVWTFNITDDSSGYLEFGDGSRQSFATDKIPQIPAANDYYLTEQDSGKHIFFEDETGTVYIPHWSVKNLPVGFTVTIINTTGGDCFVNCQDNLAGDGNQGQLKLAGRNIQTSLIGIPDSGSGSMVTLIKIKSGYNMFNTDVDDVYPDVWMVSGPGDVYNNNI